MKKVAKLYEHLQNRHLNLTFYFNIDYVGSHNFGETTVFYITLVRPQFFISESKVIKYVATTCKSYKKIPLVLTLTFNLNNNRDHAGFHKECSIQVVNK